jgi:hypothetical protein
MSRDWEKDLEFIRGLTPPPAEPFGTPVDWGRFEAENGFSPPSDFRALVDVYGAGFFISGRGELEIPQPLHPGRTFVQGVQWQIDGLQGLQARFVDFEPRWPSFPAPDGFLPLGGTGIGWTVGWLTRGDPDEWSVAINANRDGWAAELRIGIVQFVRRWLTGNLGLVEAGAFEAGEVRFLAQSKNAAWSGRTCHVKIEFGPTPDAPSFGSTPLDQLGIEVLPGQVESYGAFGDRAIPIHADISLGYRPDEEPLVIEAVERLATRLGTTIASVIALDGTPGWPARRIRNRTEPQG